MFQDWTVKSLKETLKAAKANLSHAIDSFINGLEEAQEIVKRSTPEHQEKVKEFCILGLAKPRK